MRESLGSLAKQTDSQSRCLGPKASLDWPLADATPGNTRAPCCRVPTARRRRADRVRGGLPMAFRPGRSPTNPSSA